MTCGTVAAFSLDDYSGNSFSLIGGSGASYRVVVSDDGDPVATRDARVRYLDVPEIGSRLCIATQRYRGEELYFVSKDPASAWEHLINYVSIQEERRSRE